MKNLASLTVVHTISLYLTVAYFLGHPVYGCMVVLISRIVRSKTSTSVIRDTNFTKLNNAIIDYKCHRLEFLSSGPYLGY